MSQTVSSILSFDDLAAHYTCDETELIEKLILGCGLTPADHDHIQKKARAYVEDLRSDESNQHLIDSFLQEYGLSTPEGLALMRLAEALIRTPDFGTGRLLIRDKLSQADWSAHAQKSDSFWVNQATSGLRVTKQWIETSGGIEAKNLAAKLGDRAMGLGVARAMAIMGEHFVLGRNVAEATERARHSEEKGFTHSYDMLGEAAHTAEDAQAYFQAYLKSIQYLAKTTPAGRAMRDNPGISVKLSALHPRYEYTHRDICIPPIVEKLVELALVAKSANLSLTIDAEEADRLEISLLIFEKLLAHPALAEWDGLGLVIQAYQRRATQTIRTVLDLARHAGRSITIRLVKGAYWDMEIKRAQELGLESYPVFTRKENTDISYIACARLLLDAPDCVYPQFATHNALTTAFIAHMASEEADYEFQRLHGMGEALHQKLMTQLGITCRIYAPVGDHKDLLPYLVRRLLENGANSSFVNQLFDENLSVAEIIENPFMLAAHSINAEKPQISAPRDIFNGRRQSAAGFDVTQSTRVAILETLPERYTPVHAASLINGQDSLSGPAITLYNPANKAEAVGSYVPASTDDIDRAIRFAQQSKWAADFIAKDRAHCLNQAADRLEQATDEILQLLTLEAGKTHLDGIAEIREAVDFCRYYARQACRDTVKSRAPLGVIACISPWNFPFAIFLGQIVASLSVGNTVIAKPAEQTPLVAYKAITYLLEAGIPADAVHLIIGDGAKLGTHLSHHKDIDGICFTGSTHTAKKIAMSLAETQRPTLPFIAETGGINAMIVDSTALLEQAVQDVIASAFQSAGQRCSACRLVCVQEDVADDFNTMLAGAMQALQMGNPALSLTDVGPIIDAAAQETIATYVTEMRSRIPVIGEVSPMCDAEIGHFITPIAFEIEVISELTREIFGPVLHIMRFKAAEFETLISDINALGYGLTMGLHSRLDERVDWLSQHAKIGNLYVNRNQIGAVVGVQPFGGEGLSGTGPKAGGPHYLLRLSKSTNNDRYSLNKIDKLLIENKVLTTTSSKIKPQTKTLLKQSKDAQKQWATRSILQDQRTHLRAALQPFFKASDTLWSQLAVDREIILPGPTGESNTLSLHPRGVLVCVADTHIIWPQIARALYAGNSVMVSCDALAEDLTTFAKALAQRVQIPNLVQRVPADALGAALGAGIDGVVVNGPARTPIGENLCQRPGPILPLLSAHSDPERFYHERTVTINTTAAGGNASLLTLS